MKIIRHIKPRSKTLLAYNQAKNRTKFKRAINFLFIKKIDLRKCSFCF